MAEAEDPQGVTALVVAISQGSELQKVATDISKAFNIPEVVSIRLITTHGVEVMTEVAALKLDRTDVSIHYFMKLMRQGFNPAEIRKLYELRAELTDKFPPQSAPPREVPRKFLSEESLARREAIYQSFSLIEMLRLYKRFPDFRDLDSEDQFEMVARIKEIFARITFKKAVDQIVGFADDMRVDSLESLLEIVEDFASGEVFQTYFPNDFPDDDLRDPFDGDGVYY